MGSSLNPAHRIGVGEGIIVKRFGAAAAECRLKASAFL